MRREERFYLLQTIDTRWREHLDNMDYLRDGIHLRGLAQKDPVVEYRTEGHAMFGEMMAEVQQEVVAGLFQFVIEVDGPDGRAVIDPFTIEENMDQLITQHEDVSAFEAPGTPPRSTRRQRRTHILVRRLHQPRVPLPVNLRRQPRNLLSQPAIMIVRDRVLRDRLEQPRERAAQDWRPRPLA